MTASMEPCCWCSKATEGRTLLTFALFFHQSSSKNLFCWLLSGAKLQELCQNITCVRRRRRIWEMLETIGTGFKKGGWFFRTQRGFAMFTNWLCRNLIKHCGVQWLHSADVSTVWVLTQVLVAASNSCSESDRWSNQHPSLLQTFSISSSPGGRLISTLKVDWEVP